MKLLGGCLFIGGALRMLLHFLTQRALGLKRTEEALVLLLYLENGVGYLASPLADLLAEYARLHTESRLVKISEDSSNPRTFLTEEHDFIYENLASLFTMLGETGREESSELFDYYRKVFSEERLKKEKEKESAMRILLPIYLALSALIVILLY